MGKFAKCKECGRIVYVINEGKHCLGGNMEEIVPNTVEAAREKHIPVATVEGNLVKVIVGEVAHPMLDVHYIEWIGLTTDKGFQIKYLKPGEDPKAEFALLEGETPLEVVAYCNLHGLWGAKL